MRIVVGLGNPGHTYHGTRHNVGFMVVQRLAERHRVSLDRRLVSPVDQRPACVYGEYYAGAHTVRLLMPLTMMNESGDALKAMTVDVKELMIVCDDVNLLLGTIRLRPDGGAGGHRGLQSCIDVLGTEEVARLRLGVGAQPLPRDLREYVLSPFSSSERPVMKHAIEQAADACEVWVGEGIESAMNRYNKVQDA